MQPTNSSFYRAEVVVLEEQEDDVQSRPQVSNQTTEVQPDHFRELSSEPFRDSPASEVVSSPSTLQSISVHTVLRHAIDDETVPLDLAAGNCSVDLLMNLKSPNGPSEQVVDSNPRLKQLSSAPDQEASPFLVTNTQTRQLAFCTQMNHLTRHRQFCRLPCLQLFP